MKTVLITLALILTATLIYAGEGNLIVGGMIGAGNNQNPIYSVDVIGDVNVTGTYRVNGQPVSQLNPTFRNRLTNCEMLIDQRNNGAAQTLGSSLYTIDRWYVQATGTSLIGQKIEPGPAGFKASYQITGASGNTGLYFGQKIESQDVNDLAGASVTLSFYVSSTSLSSINWQVYCPIAVDNYSGTPTYVASGSWNISSNLSCYTATFALPPSTQQANPVNGLMIQIQAPSGLNSGTLTIAGAQLEAGTSATPLERLPIGMHFVRCLRYFQSLSGSPHITYGMGIAYSPTGVVLTIPLVIPMRATPTMATSAMNTFQMAGTGVPTPSSMWVGNASAGNVAIYIGGTFTNMSPYLLQANTSSASFIQFSAEL